MMVETLFGASFVAAGALSLWSGGQLRRFLGHTPRVADAGALERYKALARSQMHLALGMLALMLVGVATGIALILRHGLIGLLAVLVANGLVFGLGRLHSGLEKQLRSLEAGPEFADEYRRVSDSWVKKALPDF